MDIKILLKCFPLSWGLIKKDKVLLILGLLPTTLGIILYTTVGVNVFSLFREWGKRQLLGKIPAGSVGTFVETFLSILIVVALFFIFQWTFVLLVSLLSSPLHQFISARTENWLITGKGDEDSKGDNGSFWKKTFKTLINEAKKLILILFLLAVSLSSGLFAPMAPVALILTCLLISIQFLDYSWSRHEWDFKDCFRDLRNHFIVYVLIGGLFLGLLTLPILNLVAMPFMVIYYTCLWRSLQPSKLPPDSGLQK